MSKHLIIGTGAVGRATASALLAEGHEVSMVSRRGVGPVGPGLTQLAADASDSDRLAELAVGAAAVYNCANPQYHRWAEDWPPMATAILTAAERSGAVLVTMSNLYGYGPVDGPMTPATPLAATYTNGRIRAEMWENAVAAHDEGRVRVTEARASDFYGPGTEETSLISRAIPRLRAGKSVLTVGDPDQPHSWTFVPDVGRTLATLGSAPSAWGRAWHVPSTRPLTQRQVFETIANMLGRPSPTVRSIAVPLFFAAGLVSPAVKAMRSTRYQFTAPFIIDSTVTEEAFGLHATPLHEALEATLSAGSHQARTTQPA